jgi:Spy/CpxP family protein refolding chaperone
MQKALLTAALAVFLTAAAASASAQDAPPPPPMQGHGQPPHGGDGFQPPRGPAFAAINDLEQLRRLYAMNGREDEMIAVYHDVLYKTHDPMLRHFAYDSLARAQLKPANPDQAIATLRTSLDEDIAATNRAPRDGRPAADGPAPGTPAQPPQQ